MITSMDDYIFTSGELEKIIIDGNVLPYRQNYENVSLRGEDIAFLLESKCERMNFMKAASQDDYTENFSRSILADQPQRVAKALDGWFTNAGHFIVKEGSSWPTSVTDNVPSLYSLYPSNFISDADKEGTVEFKSGDKVAIAPLLVLFKNMAKISCFVVGSNFPAMSDWEMVDFYSDDHDPNNPYQPTARYANKLFAYDLSVWAQSWPTLSWGFDKWICTDANLTVSNPLAKSVTPIVTFNVYEESIGLGHDGNRTKYVTKSLGTIEMSEGSATIASSTFTTAAESAISQAGISIAGYPGRDADVMQHVDVTLASVDMLYDLRDRTKMW